MRKAGEHGGGEHRPGLLEFDTPRLQRPVGLRMRALAHDVRQHGPVVPREHGTNFSTNRAHQEFRGPPARGGHVDVRIGVVAAENRQARDHLGIEIGVHVERRTDRDCRLQLAKPAQEFAFAIFMRGRDHCPMQIEQDAVEDLATGCVEDQSDDPLVGFGVDQPARARFGDHGHRDLAAFAIGHFKEAAHSRARATPGCRRGITDEWGVAVAEKSLQRRWRGREGVRFVLETSQEQAKGALWFIDFLGVVDG